MSRQLSIPLCGCLLLIPVALLGGCDTEPTTWRVSASFDSVQNNVACPTGTCQTTVGANKSMSGTLSQFKTDSTIATLDGIPYVGGADGTSTCVIATQSPYSTFCVQGWNAGRRAQSGRATWQDRGGPGGEVYIGTYTATR